LIGHGRKERRSARGGWQKYVDHAWADVAPHWPPAARATVRDVFARADLGVFAGSYTARALPPAKRTRSGR
jgi:hypothetical protein